MIKNNDEIDGKKQHVFEPTTTTATNIEQIWKKKQSTFFIFLPDNEANYY